MRLRSQGILNGVRNSSEGQRNFRLDVRLAVLMAFSNQSATSIRLGFPAISEADVLDPVQRRVSFYRPANIGGSLP